jgi:hypothetical protein
MAEDRLKILEERLTRLEANLQRAAGGTGAGGGGGFTAVPGTVSDPAPWGGGGGGWTFIPRPSPVVDPAPYPYGWGRPPRWISDPAPFPGGGFVVDPAPPPQVFDPGIFQSTASASLAARIGRVADPPPPDISRLSVIQLESALHSLAAERARLDSMEQMINKQLETARKQQG